jgi:PIN domain nuclease of toxin-antitoxin system
VAKVVPWFAPVVIWWLADDAALGDDVKAKRDHEPDVFLIHRDPFDRMLVAQAQCENLTLVTRDPEIRKYDVSVLHT